MKSLRFFVIVLILMGFGVILTAQRLESRNIDLQIEELQNDIEDIQEEKRRVTLQIDSEYERLALVEAVDDSPISMYDIVKVRLEQGELAKADYAEYPQFEPFDSFLNRFFNCFYP